jgi:hypothetical protein
LRRRNFVTLQQMPYTTAVGEKRPRFQPVLTKTLEASGLERFPQRAKAEAEKRGKFLWPRTGVLRRMDQRHGDERDGALRG